MVDLVCVCVVKKKRKGKRWRERKKKMKNRLQLQPGPFGELISIYNYRRASAGELILHYSYSRALSRNLKCNTFCQHGTLTPCARFSPTSSSMESLWQRWNLSRLERSQAQVHEHRLHPERHGCSRDDCVVFGFGRAERTSPALSTNASPLSVHHHHTSICLFSLSRDLSPSPGPRAHPRHTTSTLCHACIIHVTLWIPVKCLLALTPSMRHPRAPCMCSSSSLTFCLSDHWECPSSCSPRPPHSSWARLLASASRRFVLGPQYVPRLSSSSCRFCSAPPRRRACSRPVCWHSFIRLPCCFPLCLLLVVFLWSQVSFASPVCRRLCPRTPSLVFEPLLPSQCLSTLFPFVFRYSSVCRLSCRSPVQ